VSDKWDIDWQVVRVNARLIKDYDDKFNYVIDWFKDHPSKNNYGNVKNWIKMTCMGYKKDPKNWIQIIDEVNILSFQKMSLLSEVNTEDLQRVLNDLSKRKYNFQFKGRVPKGHIEFVSALEDELKVRG
jgi:hypothetical protein|tara:strand:- start:1204 stop:1590 length:387 start_codon:yes stop_codon:yes gene_type:complete